MLNAKDAVIRALKNQTVIPAYNIPYLPMMKPVVQAVVDEDSLAMIQAARIEWTKFGSQSLEAVAQEYLRCKNDAHTLLHLDHIPAIDEDALEVDYMEILRRSINAGYQSVMIDGSRLDLAGNITATRKAAELAHSAHIPCEAELGAVMGHESGPLMPYEEMFASKKGFTSLEEAPVFVRETGCDWLSVAAGSVHGAAAEHLRDQEKPHARLDVAHIRVLASAAGIPLVLHGGSGIQREYIHAAIRAGIAKINVGTELRHAYERSLRANPDDIHTAQRAVYEAVRGVIHILNISGTQTLLYGNA
jgi:ketose-bisphosphate aldolase